MEEQTSVRVFVRAFHDKKVKEAAPVAPPSGFQRVVDYRPEPGPRQHYLSFRAATPLSADEVLKLPAVCRPFA